MSEKVIGVHQPNFFPWLGYFYKISKCDVFVILDNVEFQQGNHNSITNRTKIKCAGEEKFFTLSVKKNKDSKLIKDILIDKQATHIKKHLKTIQLNYAKAACFKEMFPVIENVLLNALEQDHLCGANTYVIREVNKLLETDTPLLLASEMGLEQEDRNMRLIEICKKLNGNIYFSGRGGKKYHDETLFKNNGITIRYTDFEQQPYPQVGIGFLPGLSVLDVLLNCGVNETKKMIGK